MTLNSRVLISLGAGTLAGAVLARVDATVAARVSDVVAPVGSLWVNGLLMLVMPLVLTSLIAGVASAADLRSIGRLGRKAALTFLGFTVASAVLSIAVVPRIMGQLTVDQTAARALLASTGGAAPPAAEVLTAGQWIASLLPANPVKAAADGRLLPLVIYAVLFAVALTRLPRERATPVLALCHGIIDALRVLVGWLLALAPIGVFALALPIAARLGAAVVGAVGYYLAAMAGLCTLLALSAYPFVRLAAGVRMRAFARAVAPAQSVAFASRSSLASLPALLDGARLQLKLPEPVTAFVLPLAVSALKISAPVEFLVASYFLAKLYGITIAVSQWPLLFLQATLLSFAVPGIIFGAILTMAPILLTLGIPLEGLGLLLAVDMVADGFRSAVNVTADLAAAVVVARRESATGEPA